MPLPPALRLANRLNEAFSRDAMPFYFARHHFLQRTIFLPQHLRLPLPPYTRQRPSARPHPGHGLDRRPRCARPRNPFALLRQHPPSPDVPVHHSEHSRTAFLEFRTSSCQVTMLNRLRPLGHASCSVDLDAGAACPSAATIATSPSQKG